MDNISQADQHYDTICLTDSYSSDDELYSYKKRRARIIIDDVVSILNKALTPRRAQELLSLWKKSLFRNDVSAFNLRLTYDYYAYFFYPMVANYVAIMQYISQTADKEEDHGFDFSICQQLRKRKAKKFAENDFEFRIIPHCGILENVRLNVLNEMADNNTGRKINHEYSHL